MRHRHALTQWGVVLGFLVFLTSPALAASERYYLSLGTSLSVGVQPNARGKDRATDEGYADQLHRLLGTKAPELKLVKLGCPGETTAAMISGEDSKCKYHEGSQLNQALAFLQRNAEAVSLVTIDMGANDLLACIRDADHNGTIDTVDMACVGDAFTNVAVNLQFILTELQKAAGPSVPIVAMNYYNPLVATWLQGPNGALLAQQSAVLVTAFNNILEGTYGAFGVPVGDVAGAFHADDFELVPGIDLPRNVVIVCQLTWMCAPPPRGPNVHANQAGYFVIALVLAATLH